MTNSTNDKKPFVPNKPSSPFAVDPHNNRNGKGGNRNNSPINGKSGKMKSINLKKFKGGSGGDR